jgi:antitoxin VapB
MGLNIKNDETQRLSRELAAATGETITGAITVAVKERLERVRAGDPGEVDRRRSRLRKIADDAAPRWSAELGTHDHGDLLYDDRGLPR